MANQNHDIASFKGRLESGGYKNLTGARRAIGKFQEWSDEDREKARKLAEKHFPEEAEAAPKKKAAASDDGSPKRRGRPPGSKNKPKEGATAKAEKPAKVAKPAKIAAAAPAQKRKPGRPPAAAKAAPPRTPVPETKRRVPRAIHGQVLKTSTSDSVTMTMSSVIGTITQAINAIRDSRSIVSENSKSGFDGVLSNSVKVLGRAVSVLDQDVISKYIGEESNKDQAQPEAETSEEPARARNGAVASAEN